ncbi:MAG TPA: DNA-binding response regulator [Actinobacteria bacterium]|nr:DNA-binding response regulator [Actinomycetota bacterium]
MPQILIVEDDPEIRRALIHALQERGHAVASSPTGMQGLNDALTGEHDLVVLDLGLPDIDGLELLRMLRAVSSIPVIVVTARGDEASLVRALEVGADDFVPKPFSAASLDARVRAVLRRVNDDAPADSTVTVGNLVINPEGRTVNLDGQELDLTAREFDLLLYLARHTGRVVSKRELTLEVWQQAYGGADKTVDVHLSWLRRKLGETAAEPRYIRSVRNVGVKLVAPED